ncbi:hypothetical protein IMSAGC002_00369 [Lachnospiraceae bacterium]|nr:hypothetical protein IMSAGC002_00369 [Lachnospiraceae bacterium]
MLFSFSNHTYAAIIGDIKDSRKLDTRKQIQKNLNHILNQLNTEYSFDISAKFTITLGDEFQGLLHNCTNLLHIIETIQREMYPVKLRFGIGVGEITTDINPELAIGADGPSYYYARKAIHELRNNEKKNKMPSADIRISTANPEHPLTSMFNTTLSLLTVIRDNWTKRQREIIWEYDKFGGSQEDCANRLHISQSSVQRALMNGNYYSYKSAMNNLNNILKEIGELHV